MANFTNLVIKNKGKVLATVSFDGKVTTLDTKDKYIKESFARPQIVGIEDTTIITDPLEKLNSILRGIAHDKNYDVVKLSK